MKALTLAEVGSSNVLKYAEIADPVIKEGEVLVEMKAIGLNYADIMRRKGELILRGTAPFINGFEGAGVIKETQHGNYQVGDRVAFADVPFANAEFVRVQGENIIPLPPDISFELAASSLLQGLTAQFLTQDSHPVKEGETVLIHASSGGVGQLLIQLCKMSGASVIGLTSSENKRQISLSLGSDAVYLYNQDWKEKVLQLVPTGVDVVYDSIGTTMGDSLAVTRDLGKVVFYGMDGGSFVLGNPLSIIGTSKTITGGDLWNYLTSHTERLRRSTQLFDWIREKKIVVSAPAVFKLSDGKLAHDFLESRTSTGKIIMIP